MVHRRAYAVSLALGIVLGLFSWASTARSDSPYDIMIIANKTRSENSLNLDEVRAIFKKKRTDWKNGGKIVPINAPEESNLRVSFQRRVLVMEPEEEQSYWNDQQARGKSNGPPPKFKNTQKAIFHLKRALGYVFRKDYIPAVCKVLLIVPNRP
jgi:ABC-type phosphate transport system substrate-binding protein